MKIYSGSISRGGTGGTVFYKPTHTYLNAASIFWGFAQKHRYKCSQWQK